MNFSRVYVASKGRSDDCKTVARLLAEECPVTLVVEPHEAPYYWRTLCPDEAYTQVHSLLSLVILPHSNKGITYVRNFILGRAREAGHKHFWMLDDDIQQTYLTIKGKCIKHPLSDTLHKAEQILANVPNLALGALEYKQYSWSAKKPLAVDSYCDVAVLVNVENTRGFSYRDGCKEDRDFALQAITRGFRTARSTWTCFQAPKNGTNKGGLSEDYAKGLETHWSTKMVKLWPGICQHFTKSDGRPDVKVNWKLARA